MHCETRRVLRGGVFAPGVQPHLHQDLRAKEIPPELLDEITGGPVAGSAFKRHIERYIAERINLTPPLSEASLRRTKPDCWEALIGTVAQAWIEEGRVEGIEKGVERDRSECRKEGLAREIERGLADGRAKGRIQALAELLLRQLSLRFGGVPDAVLVAASLDEVLAAKLGR